MEILRASLDDYQVAGAAELDRNALVLAGPGSGKTRLLVHRVGYLLRLRPRAEDRVLCLTFTVEAAKEMRRRLAELVPRDDLRRVTTLNFHQFCLELLRSYGHLIGLDRSFGVLGEVEQYELVEEVVAARSFGRVHTRSVITAISRRKGRRDSRGDPRRGLDARSLGMLFDEYEARKTARNELDFDDLILKAVELLEQEGALRCLLQATFPNVEIDELQDTSLLQLRLLQLLYRPGASRFFAVADDDQMVYEWRDARPETLNEYESCFHARTHVLGYNYRCPQRIVDAAGILIANNAGRRAKAVESRRAGCVGRIVLAGWRSQEEQALDITQAILVAVNEGGRRLRDHAVLARVNQSLVAVQTALREARVESVDVAGRDVARSPAVRVVMGALRHVAGQPGGKEAILRACDQAGMRLGLPLDPRATLAQVETIAREFDPGFVDRLVGVLGMLDALRALGLEQEARNLERLLALAELARSESSWADYGSMLRTLTVEFNSLLGRVNLQVDAVRLMTVHGAKGLQFPVVFVPDLSDGVFPNLRSARGVNLEEERRLLFVAMTRAEEEVRLSWSEEGLWGRTVGASHFIDELLRGGAEVEILD